MIYCHALKPRSRFELLLAAIEIEILLSFILEIEDMILNRISFLTIYYLFIISSTNSFYDYTMFAFISRWIFHDGFTLAFFFLIVRGKVQSEVTRVKVFFFLKAKRREILIQPPVNLNHRPSFPASQVAKRQTKNISAIIEKLRGFRDIVISFFSASRRFFENSFRFNSQQCFSTLFLPFLFSLR